MAVGHVPTAILIITGKKMKTELHSVPDTSGEALSRAQQALFEGRMRIRDPDGPAAMASGGAPDAPLYTFLRDLGAQLETMAREIRAAHAAIDPDIVPMASTTQGDPRLDLRVTDLMAKAKRVSEMLVIEAECWRALASALDMDVRTLHTRIVALADSAARTDFAGTGKRHGTAA